MEESSFEELVLDDDDFEEELIEEYVDDDEIIEEVLEGSYEELAIDDDYEEIIEEVVTDDDTVEEIVEDEILEGFSANNERCKSTGTFTPSKLSVSLNSQSNSSAHGQGVTRRELKRISTKDKRPKSNSFKRVEIVQKAQEEEEARQWEIMRREELTKKALELQRHQSNQDKAAEQLKISEQRRQERLAEERRRLEEDAERKRAEDEKRRQGSLQARLRLAQEQKAREAEAKRQFEAEQRKRQEEEADRKRIEDERRRKEEEAERKRKKDEERLKCLEEECQRQEEQVKKRKATAVRQREAAERKRKEEEAEKQRLSEEVKQRAEATRLKLALARKQREAKQQKQREEQEKKKQQNEECRLRQDDEVSQVQSRRKEEAGNSHFKEKTRQDEEEKKTYEEVIEGQRLKEKNKSQEIKAIERHRQEIVQKKNVDIETHRILQQPHQENEEIARNQHLLDQRRLEKEIISQDAEYEDTRNNRQQENATQNEQVEEQIRQKDKSQEEQLLEEQIKQYADQATRKTAENQTRQQKETVREQFADRLVKSATTTGVLSTTETARVMENARQAEIDSKQLKVHAAQLGSRMAEASLQAQARAESSAVKDIEKKGQEDNGERKRKKKRAKRKANKKKEMDMGGDGITSQDRRKQKKERQREKLEKEIKQIEKMLTEKLKLEEEIKQIQAQLAGVQNSSTGTTISSLLSVENEREPKEEKMRTSKTASQKFSTKKKDNNPSNSTHNDSGSADQVVSVESAEVAPNTIIVDKTQIPSTPTLLYGWMEALDPASGRTYYYSQIDGLTSWDRPISSENQSNFGGDVKTIVSTSSPNIFAPALNTISTMKPIVATKAPAVEPESLAMTGATTGSNFEENSVLHKFSQVNAPQTLQEPPDTPKMDNMAKDVQSGSLNYVGAVTFDPHILAMEAIMKRKQMSTASSVNLIEQNHKQSQGKVDFQSAYVEDIDGSINVGIVQKRKEDVSNEKEGMHATTSNDHHSSALLPVMQTESKYAQPDEAPRHLNFDPKFLAKTMEAKAKATNQRKQNQEFVKAPQGDDSHLPLIVRQSRAAAQTNAGYKPKKYDELSFPSFQQSPAREAMSKVQLIPQAVPHNSFSQSTEVVNLASHGQLQDAVDDSHLPLVVRQSRAAAGYSALLQEQQQCPVITDDIRKREIERQKYAQSVFAAAAARGGKKKKKIFLDETSEDCKGKVKSSEFLEIGFEDKTSWKKPAWANATKKLKPTQKGKKMKESGNIAAPVTFPKKKPVNEGVEDDDELDEFTEKAQFIVPEDAIKMIALPKRKKHQQRLKFTMNGTKIRDGRDIVDSISKPKKGNKHVEFVEEVDQDILKLTPKGFNLKMGRDVIDPKDPKKEVAAKWEKPSWTTHPRLKSTEQGEAIKEGQNLAKPVTHIEKDDTNNINFRAHPAFLKTTTEGQLIKIGETLSAPITFPKKESLNVNFEAHPAYLRATDLGDVVREGASLANPITHVKKTTVNVNFEASPAFLKSTSMGNVIKQGESLAAPITFPKKEGVNVNFEANPAFLKATQMGEAVKQGASLAMPITHINSAKKKRTVNAPKVEVDPFDEDELFDDNDESQVEDDVINPGDVVKEHIIEEEDTIKEEDIIEEEEVIVEEEIIEEDEIVEDLYIIQEKKISDSNNIVDESYND